MYFLYAKKATSFCPNVIVSALVEKPTNRNRHPERSSASTRKTRPGLFRKFSDRETQELPKASQSTTLVMCFHTHFPSVSYQFKSVIDLVPDQKSTFFVGQMWKERFTKLGSTILLTKIFEKFHSSYQKIMGISE